MELTHNDTLAEGEEIICIGARTADGNLTDGKRYQALYGIEEGIFSTSPYVTVIGDDGRRYSCHASRFRKLTPED